jgi:pyrimidine nucleoside transport protein
LTLQFCFGLLILRWEVGRQVFQCFGAKIRTFLAYTDAGSGFVFGYLVSQKPFYTGTLEPNSTAFEVATAINENNSIGGVFQFKILSVIFFFSFISSMAFYLGTMQWLIEKIGWLLQVRTCVSLWVE